MFEEPHFDLGVGVGRSSWLPRTPYTYPRRSGGVVPIFGEPFSDGNWVEHLDIGRNWSMAISSSDS